MTDTTRTQIIKLEKQLKQAMLASDVSVLSQLLAPEIIITNHPGQLMGRQDDLSAHSSGLINLHTLNPSEQKMQSVGAVAIVSVRMKLTGSYNGSPASGDFRITRVWAPANGSWLVVAAHIGLVA